MPTALNFRTLDLNLLRVFDVAMAKRNLTRAAERLSITQPAVSNALKRLKDSVGEDLLTRVATGVRPAPRADALWPEVRAALGNLRDAQAPDAFDPAADAVDFRVATTDAVATSGGHAAAAVRAAALARRHAVAPAQPLFARPPVAARAHVRGGAYRAGLTGPAASCMLHEVD